MDFDFIKMHGLGNDFVIVNNIGSRALDLSEKSIISICNRNTGVGCDQFIIVESAQDCDADCEMIIYNSDGSKAGACGNATRCVAKLLKTNIIKVGDRRLKTTLHQNGEVSVSMGSYTRPQLMEVLGYSGYFIDIGNPHFVCFTKDADIDTDIKVIGPKIEKHSIFLEGVNVSCASIVGSGSINLKVWERGMGETLACGSAACAAAIAAYHFKGLDACMDVHLKGGTLNISVTDRDVQMRGPACEVFTGRWEGRASKVEGSIYK